MDATQLTLCGVSLLFLIGIPFLTWWAFQHEKKAKKSFLEKQKEINGSNIVDENIKDKFLRHISVIYIIFIVFIPLLVVIIYSAPLFYYSGLMIYAKVHLWIKYGTTIDVSTYTCITSSSKYCTELASSPPFNYIPPEFIKWLIEPKDWIGLHSIVKPIFEFPFWFVGFTVAWLIFLLCAGFAYGAMLLIEKK